MTLQEKQCGDVMDGDISSYAVVIVNHYYNYTTKAWIKTYFVKDDPEVTEYRLGNVYYTWR